MWNETKKKKKLYKDEKFIIIKKGEFIKIIEKINTNQSND